MPSAWTHERGVIEFIKKMIHMIVSARCLSGEIDARMMSKSFNFDTIEIQSLKEMLDLLFAGNKWVLLDRIGYFQSDLNASCPGGPCSH